MITYLKSVYGGLPGLTPEEVHGVIVFNCIFFGLYVSRFILNVLEGPIYDNSDHKNTWSFVLSLGILYAIMSYAFVLTTYLLGTCGWITFFYILVGMYYIICIIYFASQKDNHESDTCSSVSYWLASLISCWIGKKVLTKKKFVAIYENHCNLVKNHEKRSIF